MNTETSLRYANYARLSYCTPDQMRARDQDRYGDRADYGFKLLNGKLLGRFYREHPEAFTTTIVNGVTTKVELIDSDLYDVWMTVQVDEELARRKVRMDEDAEMIRHVGFWPMSHLRLKTQPWITNETGMRFAVLHCTDPLSVIEQNRVPVTFATVEEMVETWSVD